MTGTIRETYLAAVKELHLLDLDRCAAVLGLTSDGGSVEIPFYDQTYTLREGRIGSREGKPPTDAVGLVLCRYLLNCPDTPLPEGRQLTFRELDGAGPLVSSFATNTNKIITSAFTQSAQALEAAGRRLNGNRCDDVSGYDLVMEFAALPRVSVFLQFNAVDDPFPAQCSLLFHHCAQDYLDMQALFILGTYLAGGLVRHNASDAV